jgi:uncharacterized lipoprotein YddW (UPF0748 family)
VSGIDRRGVLAAAAAVTVVGCATRSTEPPPLSPDEMPPMPPRELRAAWVATVANIDWPRTRGAERGAEQRAEINAIVARANALGLNALMLQVRPAADALYDSRLEPASEFVSGLEGLAPRDYDPLGAWIAAAHRAGIELHAWFNPFRARHASATSPPAPNHVSQRMPQWVRRYGDQLWLDPGEPGAAEHTLAVIEDVVRRYDIDGVHLDDYFYPYPVRDTAGAEVPFPDADSHARSGTTLARDDWRRDNVDRFVRALSARVHAVKPWLPVGISPFALPRAARRPPGIEGFDPHAKLYADAERWFEQGWIDYAAPQLYWPLAQRAQAFGVLLDHWAAINARGRHLWPGLYTSRVGNPWPADEIVAQLAHLRVRPALAGGHIHFSMVALMDDRGGLASRLRAAPAVPALVPASPWRPAPPPPVPLLRLQDGSVAVQGAVSGDFTRVVIWQRQAERWSMSVHHRYEAITLPLSDAAAPPLQAVVASTLGLNGVESARIAWRVPAGPQ